MSNCALSRNGGTNPFGKLDDDIPKFRIDSITKCEAIKLASAAEMPLQEWVRELIRIRVHGLEQVKKIQADRVDLVAGMCGESGRR